MASTMEDAIPLESEEERNLKACIIVLELNSTY